MGGISHLGFPEHDLSVEESSTLGKCGLGLQATWDLQSLNLPSSLTAPPIASINQPRRQRAAPPSDPLQPKPRVFPGYFL